MLFQFVLMMRSFTLTIFLLFFILTAQAQTKETYISNNHVVLNFNREASDKTYPKPYIIKRAKGRFGNYETIGTTSTTSFVDKTASGNLFNYYYRVFTKNQQIAQLGLEIELFGENTYIYSP